MWNKALRVSEWTINLLSLALLVFISVKLLKPNVGAGKLKRPASLQRGQIVPLAGVDWSKADHTLVLALQTGCHYRAESAPFYRELLREHNDRNWQTVAILPQPVQQSAEWMRSEGHLVPDVRQIDLSLVGVSGTPTLLLVDRRGRLERQWVGKLSKSSEDEVASALGVATLSSHLDGDKIVAGIVASPLAMYGDFGGTDPVASESGTDGLKNVRLERQTDRDPVRVVQVLEGDTDVTPLGSSYRPNEGKPFQADDDWLKHIAVVLENFSDKEIVAGSISIDFPQTGTGMRGSPITAVPVMLGRTPEAGLYRRNGTKRNPETAQPLDLTPNQRLTVPFAPYYDEMKESLTSKQPMTSITTCWVRLQFFYFADGTRWSPSGFEKPDLNTPGKWLRMTADEIRKTTPVVPSN